MPTTRLPVLFAADLVVLPGMVVPVELDESTRAAVDAASVRPSRWRPSWMRAPGATGTESSSRPSWEPLCTGGSGSATSMPR